MNQRTAKLLNRYAEEVGANYKEVRRDWESLNQKQKAQRRKLMESLLRRAEQTEQS